MAQNRKFPSLSLNDKNSCFVKDGFRSAKASFCAAVRFLSYFLIAPLFLLLQGCTFKGAHNLTELRIANIPADNDWSGLESSLDGTLLTLEDLIKLAIENNLELAVKNQQVAVQHEVATGQKLQMLPNLLISTEISQRNNGPGSASASLVPNVAPAPPSVSANRHVFRWDATFTWNLIEFGVSYYRYRQEMAKTLISALEYRRQEQNLISNTVQAYWKVVAMSHAIAASNRVGGPAGQQAQALDNAIQRRIIPAVPGYKDEARLLVLHGSVLDLEKEYYKDLYDLKQRVGVPPSFNLNIYIPAQLPEEVELTHSVEQLAEIALLNRPELYAADSEELIHYDEVRAAVVQMFPGVALFGSEFYDSNTFLVNNNWLIAGIRAGWGLLSIPQRIQEADLAKARAKQSRITRMNASIGVLSQVYLSWILYRNALEDYRNTLQQNSVYEKMIEGARLQRKVGKINDVALLSFESDALENRVRTLRLFGALQEALEQLNNAIGMPLFLSKGEFCCSPVCASSLLTGEGICNTFD